jgi:hypothetical protein
MGIMLWDSHDESLEASVGRINLRKWIVALVKDKSNIY